MFHKLRNATWMHLKTFFYTSKHANFCKQTRLFDRCIQTMKCETNQRRGQSSFYQNIYHSRLNAYKSSHTIFIRNCTHSALYVSHTDHTRAGIVQVDLDLDNKFQDISKLDSNVLGRGIGLNVYELHTKYKALKELKKVKENLEEERMSIAEQFKLLDNNSSEDDIQRKNLITRGREIRVKFKTLAKNYFELEEAVIIDALKLPADLHQSAPKESLTMKEIGQKPQFKFRVRSHVELTQKSNSVIYSKTSPGAYYLKDKLASLSHSILKSVDKRLLDYGLTPVVCPGLVKALIVEGCGYPYDNPKQVFTIEGKSSDIEAFRKRMGVNDDTVMTKTDIMMHLTGVSPMAFIAYLTKMNISSSSLPLRYYSIGTTYRPKSLYQPVDYPSLLLAPQAEVTEVFGCARNSSEMENIYQENIKIMEELYTWLNLPVRIVCSGHSDLDLMESARTEAQVWMPSLKQFVKIGWISTWDDFASRRLMINHIDNLKEVHHKNYVFTVHGTLLHMPTFIAAIIENTQTQNGQFQVPVHLLDFVGS